MRRGPLDGPTTLGLPHADGSFTSATTSSFICSSVSSVCLVIEATRLTHASDVHQKRERSRVTPCRHQCALHADNDWDHAPSCSVALRNHYRLPLQLPIRKCYATQDSQRHTRLPIRP